MLLFTQNSEAENKKIVIWGAGQSGITTFKLLKRHGVKAHAFLDSSPEKIGTSLKKLPVFSPEILNTDLLWSHSHCAVFIASMAAHIQIAWQLEAAGWRAGEDYFIVPPSILTLNRKFSTLLSRTYRNCVEFYNKSKKMLLISYGKFIIKQTNYNPSERFILAFTGTDVDFLTSTECFFAGKSLFHYIRKGYTLLALDTKAIDTCLEFGITPLLPSEIIAEDELVKAFDKGDENWATFINACSKEATATGINWLQQDSMALRWMRNEVIYMQVLADMLKKMMITKLAFVQYNPPKPALYYYHSSIWQSIIYEMLPEIAEPIKFFGYSPELPALTEKKYPEFRFVIDDHIVIILNAGELPRFHNTLKNIFYTFPGKYVLILIGGTTNDVLVWEKNLGIPVLLAPSITFGLDSSKFSCLFVKICEALSKTEVWHAVAWNFEYYYSIRWPSLSHWAEWWNSVLRQKGIISVIGSTLEDLESQIPLLVAHKYGIKTIGLPHSYVFKLLNKYDLYAINTFIAPSNIEKDIMANMYPEVEYICSSIINLDNEYNMDKIIPINNLTILCITGQTIGTNTSTVPYISQNKQIEALKEIWDLKESLDCDVLFKEHPSCSEFSLYKLAGVNIDTHLLPLDMDLFSLVSEKTIIIMLNYLGAPAFHAIKMNIPVVIIGNTKIINHGITANYYDCISPPFSEINGLVFSSVEDAAATINKLVNSEEFRSEVLKQQQLFFNRYMVTDNNVDIVRDALFPVHKRMELC